MTDFTDVNMDMGMGMGMESNTKVGGMSVSNLLKNNKNILDIEGVLFSRFSNMAVPLGLHLYPIVSDAENSYDNRDIDITENHQFINSKKYDDLFYSVGKDLGISKSKTYKNRTMKNPTK
jgi:hypothetical protein